MSDHKMIQEQVETAGASPEIPADQIVRKKKRYQGYDIEKIQNRRKNKKGPWFWKVLGISLLLSCVIIAAACVYFIRGDQKKTDYLAGINEANTMDALLEGHKNVTVTQSYSHLKDETDYSTVRYVTKTKSGDYYSYLKKEQGEEENKEVIKDQCLYRYDGNFSRFYGLVDNDYEDTCVAEIEGCVYQNSGKENIEDESDKGTLINIRTTANVQEGDIYNTLYGFEPGSKIEKTIVMDKESSLVTSATEKCNDEEFYSYLVEFDGEAKMPKFFQTIQNKKKHRTCKIYMNYGSDDQQTYSYKVPYDVYFTWLEREGYKCYMDEDCSREFSEYQLQIENPEGDISLYMKKE